MHGERFVNDKRKRSGAKNSNEHMVNNCERMVGARWTYEKWELERFRNCVRHILEAVNVPVMCIKKLERYMLLRNVFL